MVFWTNVTKNKPMFCHCSRSWHFLVVFNKIYGCFELVFLYYCLIFHLYKSIHVKFKLVVMVMPMHLCILLNFVLMLHFSVFILFYDTPVNTSRIPYSLILDISCFYFPMYWFICNSVDFKCLTYIFLWVGVISGI